MEHPVFTPAAAAQIALSARHLSSKAGTPPPRRARPSRWWPVAAAPPPRDDSAAHSQPSVVHRVADRDYGRAQPNSQPLPLQAELQPLPLRAEVQPQGR